jgi:peroxiredoxin (alkyl hydroperoxide reductase subunit C)
MEDSDLTISTTMPRIGDIAPDFYAKTTKGDIKFSEFAKDIRFK